MRTILVALLFCMAPVIVPSVASAQETEGESLRIGTFDSRAVALAYYRSPGVLDEMVGEMKVDRQEALEEGDSAKAEELEIRGKSMQHLMHQQVFSTGSICNLYPAFQARLDLVAQDAGVIAIVSKWELPYSTPGLDIVDVTYEVVALFETDEEVEKMVGELLVQDPVPLEDLYYDPEH